MALVRLPRRLRPPATKSGRLTPSKMREKLKRDRVWTNEDVVRCELEYLDPECKKSAYFATMHDGTRKRLVRCTTVTGMLKGDALINWAARMAAQYIQSNWTRGRGYTQDRIDAICDNAASAHDRFKNFTGDLGTEAHAYIEKWLNTGIWPNEFLRYLESGEWPSWANLDPRVGNSLMLFLNQWDKLGMEMVATEYRVYDVSLMTGGTADCIAIDRDGNYVLIDHKTGNGVYESQIVQVAFYYNALRRMGSAGFPISRVIILRIGRQDAVAQVVELTESELAEAFECFELLAALRPTWNRLAGRCYRRNVAWREENNAELDRHEQIDWENQDEAA